MLQSDFTTDPVKSQPGELELKVYAHSKLNGEVSAGLPFGRFCQIVSDKAQVLNGITNVIGGVVIHTQKYERLFQLDTNGDIKPNVMLELLAIGAIRVETEEAVAFGDPVHIRCVAGAGGSKIGVVRKTAVAGETKDFSSSAKFLKTAAAGEFAWVWVDLANDVSISAVEIPDSSLTLAKIPHFTSAELTGTGASQNVAHGLGVVPSMVWFAWSDTTPATLGSCVMTPGAHDATNLKFTATTNKKFIAYAIA